MLKLRGNLSTDSTPLRSLRQTGHLIRYFRKKYVRQDVQKVCPHPTMILGILSPTLNSRPQKGHRLSPLSQYLPCIFGNSSSVGSLPFSVDLNISKFSVAILSFVSFKIREIYKKELIVSKEFESDYSKHNQLKKLQLIKQNHGSKSRGYAIQRRFP